MIRYPPVLPHSHILRWSGHYLRGFYVNIQTLLSRTMVPWGGASSYVLCFGGKVGQGKGVPGKGRLRREWFGAKETSGWWWNYRHRLFGAKSFDGRWKQGNQQAPTDSAIANESSRGSKWPRCRWARWPNCYAVDRSIGVLDGLMKGMQH